MFTTEIARSGELTLFIEGKAVHSKYDPVAEANTFLKKQCYKNSPHIFILIGPGLGYLKSSIIKVYPKVKILSLHLDKQIFKYANKIGHNWIYGDNKDLGSELSHLIPDFLLSETVILKWFPCTENFPARTKYIETRIQQFFLERKGSIFTTGYFGRKWIRNAYYNFIKTRQLVKIDNIDLPVLIAASGPSLRDAIDIIRDYRDKFILAALPSSLAALNDADIRPDFIFHTDPGFWANEHLKHLQDTAVPIIMPLTSSFKSNLENPVIFINQGSFLENMLLGDTFLQVPSHGTVAGTAYLFLRKITNSPVVYLGLDFCFNDVLEHVKPHSFDILNNLNQNRFLGYLHILFEKHKIYTGSANNSNTTSAFSTYSGWFNNESRLSNAFRFNPTEIITNGLISIDSKQLIILLNRNFQIGKTKKFTKLTDINFNKTTFNKILNYIILLLDNFRLEIPTMNSEQILNFFTNSNLLTEVFQYTAYSDILKLTHYYRNDINKSIKLLEEIYSKTHFFIEDLLIRSKYE